ncbi:MAG: four helix bundle protein [Bacteroidota bacterium]|nr:four helix bundle protein [Bacteroidota bacterium]
MDLRERLFLFSISTIKLCRSLDQSPESKIIRYQLIRSGTSSGANYEEAQAAFSKKDFHYKICTSLKEMRESNYWLKIIRDTTLIKSNKVNILINESEQLMKILATIAKKTSHIKT